MIEVVIVDDEPLEAEGNRRRILRMQSVENVISQISVFTSAPVALSYLKMKKDPVLVILDMNMPELSGNELMQQLKNQSHGFIVISAHDDFRYAQQSMRYGVRHYLLKPCTYTEFHDAVKNMLELLAVKKQCNSVQEQSLADDSQQNVCPTQYSGIVQRAIAYIEEHISEKITMSDLCSYCHINYCYFSQLFKKELGVSFSDYIQSRKMQIAAEKLVLGYTIQKAAESVGFTDYNNFFRAFKQYYAMTPGEWLKK